MSLSEIVKDGSLNENENHQLLVSKKAARYASESQP